MGLTTGYDGSHKRILWLSEQDVMAPYYQESIFCWCILQTNKWRTWHSGVYRFGINPRQSVFRPPLHSVRYQSCTTKCSRNTQSRVCDFTTETASFNRTSGGHASNKGGSSFESGPHA